VLTSPLGRAGVLNRYEDELKKGRERIRKKERARVARINILYESFGIKLSIIWGGRCCRSNETYEACHVIVTV